MIRENGESMLETARFYLDGIRDDCKFIEDFFNEKATLPTVALKSKAANLERAVAEQYVKLPMGSDCKYVKPGDVVYGGDGKRWGVLGIGTGQYRVIAKCPDTREYRELKPKWLTHEAPDSWGKLYDDVMWSADSVTKIGLAQFKERALALADKEPRF